MGAYATGLLRYRELLYALTWRDIKIRYKQSVMGILWAIFMPMIIVMAGIVVRFAFAQVSGKPLDTAQIATVAVKAVAWAFFVSALRFGTNSLVANPNLVTKIYFPKMLFPMASVASSLFDFCIASATVTALLLIVGTRLGVQLLWAPVLAAVLVVVVLGLAGLLAVANLFFRDVKYLVEIIVTFAIFFTPVFYDASLFGRWEHVVMLNPVAPILEGFKSAVVMNRVPQLDWLAYSAVTGVVLLLATVWAFATLEPRFAENI
jgi:lipopolysaccharide transport system permease protein